MNVVELARGTQLYESLLDKLRTLVCAPPNSKFPGPQPIALNRDAVNEIRNGSREYLVCPKTDGVRRVLFFTKVDGAPKLISLDQRLAMEQLFFVDEDDHFEPRLFEDTILDAELAVPREDASRQVFVVFDAYAAYGLPCGPENLAYRLRCAQNVVAQCPSRFFEMKLMFPRECMADLLRYMTGPNARYACDGVIFNPVPDPCYFGTHPLMFKWKPLHQLTCDFLIRPVVSKRGWASSFARIENDDANWELWFLDEEGKLELFTAIFCADDRLHKEEIWEMAKIGVWTPYRLRNDKRHPNFKETVLNTLRCRKENVRLEEFLD